MFENHPSGFDKSQEKGELFKLLENRARSLEEELLKAKKLRTTLEAEKMFWKNRQEEFRAECFRIKRLSGTQQENESRINGETDMLQEMTERILGVAERHLKQPKKSNKCR